MNENVSMTKEEIYSKDYIPYSIKYGRMTSLIGVAASFVPLIVLALVFGVMPTANSPTRDSATSFLACCGTERRLRWISRRDFSGATLL